MTDITETTPTLDSRLRAVLGPRFRAALGGSVAAGVGMASAELLAGLVRGVPSLVIAVGTLVIAMQPPGAKDFMVGLFGTNDKLALNLAVIVVALLVAAWVGVIARRSFGTAAFIFGLFGVLGFVGAVYAELVNPIAAFMSAAVAVAVGLLALRVLVAAAEPAPGMGRDTYIGGIGRGRGGRLGGQASMPDWDRRRFLLTSASLTVAAVAAGVLGRFLLTTRRPPGPPVPDTLPAVAAGGSAPPISPDESLSAPGITPIVMPTSRFYRIDTTLIIPQVDASTWQLKVDGMVTNPLTFTYQQLLAMPLFEQYVTIACVSNQVGGDLVGNALWTGVHLKEVLARAGVAANASQIVGRSVDGFTVGFPTSWALDPSREPMIAIGMNGKPLPAEHGYPARLIVPGLYGYVSATKWLAEIELTTREQFDAYWIRLGWAKDGPILTQSRIDHPHDGDTLAAGPNWIDGLAWAPDRGVSNVEIRVDGGAWQRALLSRPISKATWVQWMLQWPATPGQHTIEVRATDGDGAVQTSNRSDPAPSGARGHQTIRVTVR